MNIIGSGRVIRELGIGAIKDAYNIYIQPKLSSGMDNAKEVLLLPFSKVIKPLIQKFKEDVYGRGASITVNGEEIPFILPERYTRLGMGRTMAEILEHELTKQYRQLKRYNKKSELFIDTNMNVYIRPEGVEENLIKVLSNGELIDPEPIKISKIIGSGLTGVEDFLKRQERAIDAFNNDFVPYSNIFPANSEIEAKRLYDKELDKLKNGEFDPKPLNPENYNALLKRLSQERNFEKELNAKYRHHTEKAFLAALSQPEIYKIIKDVFTRFKRNERIGRSDVTESIAKISMNKIFPNGNYYYEEVDPSGTGIPFMLANPNPYVTQYDELIQRAIGNGPNMKDALTNRATNIAIDAGVGILADPTIITSLIGVATAGIGLLSKWLISKIGNKKPENLGQYLERFQQEFLQINQQLRRQFSEPLIGSINVTVAEGKMYCQNLDRIDNTLNNLIPQTINMINQGNEDRLIGSSLFNLPPIPQSKENQPSKMPRKKRKTTNRVVEINDVPEAPEAPIFNFPPPTRAAENNLGYQLRREIENRNYRNRPYNDYFFDPFPSNLSKNVRNEYLAQMSEDITPEEERIRNERRREFLDRHRDFLNDLRALPREQRVAYINGRQRLREQSKEISEILDKRRNVLNELRALHGEDRRAMLNELIERTHRQDQSIENAINDFHMVPDPIFFNPNEVNRGNLENQMMNIVRQFQAQNPDFRPNYGRYVVNRVWDKSILIF